MARRNRRKSTRRARRNKGQGRLLGGGNVRVNPMTPREYEASLHRNNLVFMPVAEHPKFPLATIQHMMTGGAFQGGDIDPKTLFPDGFVWDHLTTVMELYDFKVDHQEVDARVGTMVGFLFTLRAIFGADAAFRWWCGIFSAAFSDVKCVFDEKEPVVSLQGVDDSETSDGYDAWFPSYGLMTQQYLKMAVNRQRAQLLLDTAHVLPEDKFMKQSVQGFIETKYKTPKLRGAFEQDVTMSGSLGESYFPSQSQLYHSDSGPVQIGYDTYDAKAWGESQVNLAKLQVFKQPHYPIAGRTWHDLDNMEDIHRFGSMDFPRQFPHTGIDLVAAEGTAVHAMYDGKVKRIVNDWKRGAGPGGNFVIIETKFSDGKKEYKCTHEYYHLAGVEKHLEVGQKVHQGEKLGVVGNTGNSKGAHLHLLMTFSPEVTWQGRSMMKSIIDPEDVILMGLIPAMQADGQIFGDGIKPSLSVGGVMLSSVARGNIILRNGGQYGGLFEDAKAAANKAVEAAKKIDDTLTQKGGAVLDKMFEAVDEGTAGRAALEAAYNYAIPGLGAGEYATRLLDAVEAGHRANMDNQGMIAIINATVDGFEISEDDKRKAAELAISTAVNTTQNNSQD